MPLVRRPQIGQSLLGAILNPGGMGVSPPPPPQAPPGVKGGVVFGDADGKPTQDATNFFWDATNKFLGIGTNTPVSVLEVFTSAATIPRGVLSSQASADVNGASFYGRKSRGTRAVPAAVASGDQLAALAAQGYGTSFVIGAYMEMMTTEAWSATAAGTMIRFFTTRNTTQALIERMRINSEGNVDIGVSASPTYTTDIKHLDLAAIWNNAAVAFTGLRLNIVSTASAAASLLMDLQISGVSQFKVDKAGIGFMNRLNIVGVETYIRRNNPNDLVFGSNSMDLMRLFNPALTPYTDNVQTLGYDDGITSFRWNSVKTYALDIAGNVTFKTDNANDIGASGATRPRDFFLGRDAYIGRNLLVNGATIARAAVTTIGSIWAQGAGGGNLVAVNSDAVLNGAGLGAVLFQGWDGAAFQTSAYMQALGAENWSGTARGSFIQFVTTPVGTTTLTSRMTIGSAGNLSLGTPTYTTDIKHVDLSATWNAAGVLFTLIRGNANNTASASGSLLIDLQVGGVSRFKVDKTALIMGQSDAPGVWLDETGVGSVVGALVLIDSGLFQIQSRVLGFGGYNASPFNMDLNSGVVSNALMIDCPNSRILTALGEVIAMKTGQVQFHLYNGGAVAEWLTPYQPAHATGDYIVFATKVGATITDMLRIGTAGDVYLRAIGAAMATSATGGFTHIPTMAGAPTGVPATILTGALPIVFDTTNFRFYYYRAGAWHYIAETA